MFVPQMPKEERQSSQSSVATPDDASLPMATPTWFQALVVLSGCGVLAFGGIGLLLADSGHFRTAVALPLGILGTLLLGYLARPRLRLEYRNQRRLALSARTLPALLTVLVGLGLAFWNQLYSGHHIAVASDPGVYALAGRWLAHHRSLNVIAGTTWTGTGLHLTFGSAGMYPVGPTSLQFQFAHLLPALLAQSYAIGGNGLMFRTPAVLGAFGLWAIYLVGCELIKRPWIVLAAITGLGLSLPEVYVARDTYSELATQVLLWVGIWLLIRTYRERQTAVGIVAGLAIGATLMTRIDAVVYLIPLPVLGAVAWATTPNEQRRTMAGAIGAVFAGVLPAAVLGTIDVQNHAGEYYDDLSSEVHQLYIALLLSVIVAIIFLVGWKVGPLHRVFVRSRRVFSASLAGAVGMALVFGWGLRPAISKATQSIPPASTETLQRIEGLPIAPLRNYSEHSLVWISWYVGPAVLTLAIGGLCWLIVHVLRAHSASSGRDAAFVLLAITGPLTAIYLWKPAINPLQVYALRRFVPDTLPLVMLAAAFLVDALANLVATHATRLWSRATSLAGATCLVVLPLGATLPVARYQTQANFLPALLATCHAIGTNGAVLFPPGDSDDVQLAQSVRSWCNVPAAGMTTALTPTQIAAATERLRAEHKTLWVLADTPQAIAAAVPGAQPHLVASAVSPRELAGTLEMPVENYAEGTLAIYGAQLPVSSPA